MREYYITLPRGVKINIFNLPEDFEKIVKKTFSEYTEGTSKDYRYCDKLGYIDALISHITYNKDGLRSVSEHVKERFEYEWEENGKLLHEDDIYCVDFMEECYNLGRDSAQLYQHYGSNDHHIYDQIQKVVAEIIKIVMNYEEK